MERLTEILRNNRNAAGTALLLLILTMVAFPYLLGVSAALGVVLLLLVLAVAAAIYRWLNHSPVALDRPLSAARLTFGVLVGFVVVGAAIQAVPYGWDRSNPPITAEPPWDSARTRELTVRACFDCHSNEVEYPWYARVAPISWVVQGHVSSGRDAVNYSEWDRPQEEAHESAETVREGEMPPAYYTRLAHDRARLTEMERSELIAGLIATLGGGEDESDD